jgi:hypothetical protein
MIPGIACSRLEEASTSTESPMATTPPAGSGGGADTGLVTGGVGVVGVVTGVVGVVTGVVVVVAGSVVVVAGTVVVVAAVFGDRDGPAVVVGPAVRPMTEGDRLLAGWWVDEEQPAAATRATDDRAAIIRTSAGDMLCMTVAEPLLGDGAPRTDRI